MRRIYNQIENVVKKNIQFTLLNNDNRKSTPLLCGYFIVNNKDLIIEQSTNFLFFLNISQNEEHLYNINDIFEEYFLLEEELDSSQLKDKDKFIIKHIEQSTYYQISRKTLDNNRTHYFYEEIRNEEDLSVPIKANLHYLADLMPLGIVIWDNDRNVNHINKYCETIFDITKEDFYSKDLFDFFLELKVERKKLEKIFSKMSGINHNLGKCVLTDKNERDVFLEYFFVKNIYTNVNILIFQDETELATTFDHIRRVDTLNVVGQLAAGIAHEIRNPMTSIKGFIKLIKPEIDLKNNMYYEIISSELERLDLIINEFLYLSKPKNIIYEKVELNELLKSSVEIMQGQFSLHNIKLQLNLPNEEYFIRASKNELKKVFVNLLKNAQEVFVDGGRIVIDTEERKEFIIIHVNDNGCGMTEEQLNSIGKAFFTTKEKGVGLGLYVTYKIVEEHGGDIEISSELGVGTTFSVYIPKFIDKKSS